MEEEIKPEDQRITYATAFALRCSIGRLAIISYDDMELISKKVEQLEGVMKQFYELHQGDQAKANELSQGESDLTKTDLAYLSKDDFKQAIYQRGFDFDQVRILEYWLVK